MTTSSSSDAHPENETKIRETVAGVQAPFDEIWFESGGTRLFAVEAGKGRPIERAVVGGTSMGSAVAIRFALRHPSRLGGLILMSPLYPGADRELPEAASAAMRVMAEAGERAATQGVGELRQLFEGLPPPVREVALHMMIGFDAASVGATTRFLASNVQPMDSARDLEAIDTRVMILPGTDPQHPAEIAELYARNVRDPVVVEQAAPDYLQRVTEFCDRS